MTNQPAYYAEITYRPQGDTRPASECPTLGIGTYETEAERESEILRSCQSLENQPTAPHYDILSVRRYEICGRCQGSGKIRVKPHNWRKRTPAPWFMCKEIECPACKGEGK